MGYFPNGMAGEAYLERFCYRCIHWKNRGDGRGDGCPVWDLHLDMDYELQATLDHFILRSDTGDNLECRMFVEKKA